MKLSTVQKAVIAIVIANIIWGAAPAIFKVSLTNVPTFTLAFWRFFLGALILLAFLRKKTVLPTMSQKDLLLLLGYSLSGITVNIIFFFWGLLLTYSINAPVIASAAPILTYLLAMVYLHEGFRWKKMTGMVIGFLGIILIVLEPLIKTGLHASILGNTFLVIATLGAVFQNIIGKDVFHKFEPYAYTFWSFIVGAATFFPAAVYEFVRNPHLYSSLDIRGYMGIAFGAILSSAAAYGLYAWGLSVVSASDAALFTYIDPVIGSALSFFFLKEPITNYFLIGSVLIFGGIFVAENRLHYHPFHKFQPAAQPATQPATTPPVAASTPPAAPAVQTDSGEKDVHNVIAEIYEKKA